MPKLGTVTVEVWPRQQGATKNFYMDVVKAALFDKKRVCVAVMNQYSPTDVREKIAELISVGGPISIDPLTGLAAHGIQLIFTLPEPHHVYDVLFLMVSGDDLNWPVIMNYARKRIDVKVIRIYDEETHQYV